MRALIVGLLALGCGSALAQSVPNGTIAPDALWTVQQWNNAWEAKQDYLGNPPHLNAPLELSSTVNVAAAGTTQATATALTTTINVVTTAPSGSGVIIPYDPGAIFRVFNQGANAILVYPPAGAAIDGNSANVGMSVPAGSHYALLCYSTASCLSAN